MPEYIIQSYDTAFSKSEKADFSAITTWGVFKNDEDHGNYHIILLDSVKDRLDFPELKKVAYESYIHWEPDSVIIEAKASGMPLTHELRAMGIPVQNYTPTRGNDKIARTNAVAPIFESGLPNGENDDLVDSTTQALLRFRQGGFIRQPSDYEEDELEYKLKSFTYY